MTAPARVSYDVDEKINYFHAWTIAADEKQYQAQDTDFGRRRRHQRSHHALHPQKPAFVHPPAADVGATILCESEELLEPYLQETVWGIPERHLPSSSRPSKSICPPAAPTPRPGTNFRLSSPSRSLPTTGAGRSKICPPSTCATSSQPRSGPLSLARMSVQWGPAAIDGKDNQWRAIGQWVTTLEENRPDPSPEITAQTQSLIAGAPDFYAKLSRITEYIQKNVRYFIVMRGIGGLQANYAADIFRNRYGDCKDKTTLLISMLQVAGIHAFYVPSTTAATSSIPMSPP